MLKQLNEKTLELAQAKIELANAKNELTNRQAVFQVSKKEYWEKLEITNEQGRKAHITLRTEHLTKKVLEATNKVTLLEAELKCLERDYEIAKITAEIEAQKVI